ncbi:hypothetical protein MIZ03_4500 [Rhodoferax lithotrophicus]|uniref:Uncharacterized protein n=1 Tax=Rhodoferax lithotrophicus TaxID=2798804 RepID=A0ABN6DC50_9BURK|nr:hypothetical protein MIZ03_4500 [Rhodoferax sp. MIZ03]
MLPPCVAENARFASSCCTLALRYSGLQNSLGTLFQWGQIWL